MNRKRITLRSKVFVRDKDAGDFVAHIERRIAKAKRGEGGALERRVPKKLDLRIKALKNATIYC